MVKEEEFTNFLDYLLSKVKNNKGPFMATDIIIEYPAEKPEGIILIERKFFPLGLALPGGGVERNTFAENAKKEAFEETGLQVEIIDDKERPFLVLSNPNQDPRAFISTAVFRAKSSGKIKSHPNNENDSEEDAKTAKLYTFAELEKLAKNEKIWAFAHHRYILKRYLKEVRGWKG